MPPQVDPRIFAMYYETYGVHIENYRDSILMHSEAGILEIESNLIGGRYSCFFLGVPKTKVPLEEIRCEMLGRVIREKIRTKNCADLC